MLLALNFTLFGDIQARSALTSVKLKVAARNKNLNYYI